MSEIQNLRDELNGFRAENRLLKSQYESEKNLRVAEVEKRKEAEVKLDQERKYRFLLAARNRVDDLEKFLAPGVQLPSPRIDRWLKILSLKNKHALAFRKKMEEVGITSDEDRRLFCEAISKLCRDTNQHAAHTNIEMPNANEAVIRGALKVMGIKADYVVVQGFLLIASELPNPDDVLSSTSEEAN